jgi:hypothetical protein
MEMKRWIYILLVGLISLGACEKQIDLPVKDATSRLVIHGEVSNSFTEHVVQIQRTLSLDKQDTLTSISGAEVLVRELEGGRVFRFNEVSPGRYVSQVFSGQIGYTYELEVNFAGKSYQARSRMPEIVPIDSIGISQTTLFGENQKFITLKFKDPEEVQNYYRYLLRINDEPFQFIRVFSDRYNNGKFVQHDLLGEDMDFAEGQRITVIRQHVDAPTFMFWESVQNNNPFEAAPSNPPSNLSGGALGVFSAYAKSEFAVVIQNK